MTGKLAGKVALISGTGRGLGRAAALTFAAEGVRAFGKEARKEGVIINMGSVAGIRSVEFQPMTAPGVTKASMISMTRHLTAAGAEHGIRAVCISPGMIRSEATDRHFDRPGSPIPVLNGANTVIDGGVSVMGG